MTATKAKMVKIALNNLQRFYSLEEIGEMMGFSKTRARVVILNLRRDIKGGSHFVNGSQGQEMHHK